MQRVQTAANLIKIHASEKITLSSLYPKLTAPLPSAVVRYMYMMPASGIWVRHNKNGSAVSLGSLKKTSATARIADRDVARDDSPSAVGPSFCPVCLAVCRPNVGVM